MSDNCHDPMSFVYDLSAKLAARSRHVCILMGAGVGKACGLPDITDLEQCVLSAMDCDKRADLKRQLRDNNLEQALSRVRSIAAIVTGDDTVDGLDSLRAKALDTEICRQIVKALSVDPATRDPVICLAAWATRANYLRPVELFTVNYDLLIEDALEEMHAPYFDGFIGSLRARFFDDLVESDSRTGAAEFPAFLVRLWKLHGSVNWTWDSSGQIVRLGRAAPDGVAAAIFPSYAKYEESRRVPFVVLQDRFRRALHYPETLVLIAGYSFGDDHLNEHIFHAATRRERSEFVAFSYEQIPDVLAQRAMITPNLQVVSTQEAIIGGVRSKWEDPGDPHPDIWKDGTFLLPDFRYLSRYLARNTGHLHEDDRRLRGLLESAMLSDGQIGPKDVG